MNDLVPAATALAEELFPAWLREAVRMASVRAAGAGAVRFRVDPGPAFERHAVVTREGPAVNLTVTQRYLPYGPEQLVVSGDVGPEDAPEALWRGVNQANLLAPAEYWRTGFGYTARKPFWTVRTDAGQPTAVRLMEALATARASEAGTPHFVSRRGRDLWCSANAPHRGEFYSVSPAGEWSLHYHPVTYPLDWPPDIPPDRDGTHPAVLAHLRNMARPSYAPWDAATEPLPVLDSPGRAPLPAAAWPPEAFTVPFQTSGTNVTAPEPGLNPDTEPRPALGAAKENPMPVPEPEAYPAAVTITDAPGEKVTDADRMPDSPPTGDPLEGGNAEVRLAPDAARFAQAAGLAQAGFVIETHDADDHLERQFIVHFPGDAGNVLLPDELLTPAPPFPAVTTSQGEIGSMESAEAFLIDSSARIRYQLEQGDGQIDGTLDNDRIKLAKALGNACGLDPHDLVRQLDPMIDQQVTAYQAAKAAHPASRKRPGKKAPAVAAADVPSPCPGEKVKAGAGTKTRSEDQKASAKSGPAPSRSARRR